MMSLSIRVQTKVQTKAQTRVKIQAQTEDQRALLAQVFRLVARGFSVKLCGGLVVMFCGMFSLSNAYGDPQQDSVSLAPKNNDQLQWMLGVPDQDWAGPVGELAVLLDSQKNDDAKTLLEKWLVEDFTSAVLALPLMEYYLAHFDKNPIVPVYAKFVAQLKGAERMNTLAQLNLKNEAVYRVGVSVLERWWKSDPDGLQRWLAQTPSFFEDEYLELFFERVILSPDDVAHWVAFLWTLKPSDKRKGRFFNDLYADFLQKDERAAIKFADDVFSNTNANTNTQVQIQGQAVADQLAFAVAYHLSGYSQHQKALQWLSKIENHEVQEVGLRDLVLSTTTVNALALYSAWIEKHPIKSNIVEADIREHQKSLMGDDAQPLISEEQADD